MQNRSQHGHCLNAVSCAGVLADQRFAKNPSMEFVFRTSIFFYVFMNTWRHSRIKLRIFKRKGVYVRRYCFSIFVVVDRYLLYSKTPQQIGGYRFHWPCVYELKSKNYQSTSFINEHIRCSWLIKNLLPRQLCFHRFATPTRVFTPHAFTWVQTISFTWFYVCIFFICFFYFWVLKKSRSSC